MSPRGGKRDGAAGKAYPNRSDLNPQKLPAAAGPSKQYGEKARELAQQRVVPTASGDITPSGPAATAARTGPPAPGGPVPGEMGDLAGPTTRPNEPLTTGMALGPGEGPEALGPAGVDDPIEQLRALYAANPLPELAALLQEAGY